MPNVYEVQPTNEDGDLVSLVTRTSTIYDNNGNPIGGFATENELCEAYEPTKTYPTYSKYCIYNNAFYKYTGTGTSTGAFDSTKWTLTNFAEVGQALMGTDDISAIGDGTVTGAITALNSTLSRNRRNITSDLSNLPAAVAEQNLGKYGYKIGDYFNGASGYTYHLADLDTFYGGYNSYSVVGTHHIGIVVDTKTAQAWNATNDTSTGYSDSALHAFLTGTALNNIKSDLKALFGGSTGLEHLISHQKLLTIGTANWDWKSNQYISALSEIQIYGSTIWSMNGYQEGECCRGLELFRKFRFNEIFGNVLLRLRNIYSASSPCFAGNNGVAYHCGASDALRAVGLILFY